MFTVKPAFLIRMLDSATVSGWQGPVSLFASRGRVQLEGNGVSCQACAQVWDDGQCRVLARRLNEVVRRFQCESGVTVSVTAGFLRIRSAAVPVLSAGAWTEPPDLVQGDFATD